MEKLCHLQSLGVTQTRNKLRVQYWRKQLKLRRVNPQPMYIGLVNCACNVVLKVLDVCYLLVSPTCVHVTWLSEKNHGCRPLARNAQKSRRTGTSKRVVYQGLSLHSLGINFTNKGVVICMEGGIPCPFSPPISLPPTLQCHFWLWAWTHEAGHKLHRNSQD